MSLPLLNGGSPMKASITLTILMIFLSTGSAAEDLNSEQAMQNRIDELRSDVTSLGALTGSFGWRNVTDENVMSIVTTSKLTGQSPDRVLFEAKQMLRPPVKTCGNSGRINPEIALELVRTAYLTAKPNQDIHEQLNFVRSQYETNCSVKATFLSNESCAELVKTAMLKDRPISSLKDMAKQLYGWGMDLHMSPEVAAELVKAAVLNPKQTPQEPITPSQVWDKYKSIANWLHTHGLADEDAVELTKGALYSGKDVALLDGEFSKTFGWGVLGKQDNGSVSEIVKTAAAAHLPPNKLALMAHDIYCNGGCWHPFGRENGINYQTSAEIVKLSLLNQPGMKDMVSMDHRIVGHEVDHGDCPTAAPANANGAPASGTPATAKSGGSAVF